MGSKKNSGPEPGDIYRTQQSIAKSYKNDASLSEAEKQRLKEIYTTKKYEWGTDDINSLAGITAANKKAASIIAKRKKLVGTYNTVQNERVKTLTDQPGRLQTVLSRDTGSSALAMKGFGVVK